MPEQLLIAFNPVAAAARVTSWAKQIRQRVIWGFLMVAIMVWFYVWKKSALEGIQVGWVLAAGIAYSVVWIVIAIVSWARAKSQLRAISPGVAAAIDRRGIWLQGTGLAWGEITSVMLKPGWFKAPASLVVTSMTGESARLALANLDVMPGTIDSAVRSYSAGTHRVDASKLKH